MNHAPTATLCLVLLLFPMASCVTPGGTGGAKSPSSSKTEAMLFRSDRYLVCVPDEDTTAAVLAARYLGASNKAWIIEEANGNQRFDAGRAVVIPLREDNPGGLEKDGYQIVPILCYHRFGPGCDGPLCMSRETFARQMAFLADGGYHVVGLRALLDFLHYRRSLPERSVVITLDDGYRSAYDIAYPILREHGFTATLFVYTDFVGAGAGALTWEQLREMKAEGFDVGSHTVTHCDLAKPLEGEKDSAYRARVERELSQSKQILDEKLGQDTIAIAFPYGSATPGVLQLCQAVGYRLGMSVSSGGNPFFADPLVLRRHQITVDQGPPFHERLGCFEPFSLE